VGAVGKSKASCVKEIVVALIQAGTAALPLAPVDGKSSLVVDQVPMQNFGPIIVVRILRA